MGIKHYQLAVDEGLWERFKRATYREAGIKEIKVSLRRKILELMEQFVAEMESHGPLFDEIEKTGKKKAKKR